MTFKEALAFDAAHVFLNVDEFAELMTVDGEEMPAQWGEEVAPAPNVLESSVDAWGVNTEKAVLILLESRLPLPVAGQSLLVNDVAWQVIKARPKTGLIRIELQRNTA